VWLLALLGACSGSSSNGDGGADGPQTCEGSCAVTTLTATFNNTTRMLDVAYYGTHFDSPALHVEAYRNAEPGCPTGSSPTPDYTLVVRDVDPTMQSSPMALANILDFKGDLLGGPLGLAATMRQVERVAFLPGSFVAVDVVLTFSTGTVTGHLYATHCSTLDM
jgi:hypothetical protein